MLVCPNHLKSDVKRKYVKVFLCGPGLSTRGFSERAFVRDEIQAVTNTDVVLGEEIEGLAGWSRQRRDLQTLESRFAHSADFTILLLGSPGSIAELGTFSMIENLRGRLVVLVPAKYYADESYISRGPLSAVSKKHTSNVIYYDDRELSDLRDRVLFHVTLYKVLAATVPEYRKHISTDFKDREYKINSYENLVGGHRAAFYASVVLVGIIMMVRPTFPELVQNLGLTPDETSSALRLLFQENAIRKLSGGRYEAVDGFKSELLEQFNTRELSRSRAARLASLDDWVSA